MPRTATVAHLEDALDRHGCTPTYQGTFQWRRVYFLGAVFRHFLGGKTLLSFVRFWRKHHAIFIPQPLRATGVGLLARKVFRFQIVFLTCPFWSLPQVFLRSPTFQTSDLRSDVPPLLDRLFPPFFPLFFGIRHPISNRTLKIWVFATQERKKEREEERRKGQFL